MFLPARKQMSDPFRKKLLWRKAVMLGQLSINKILTVRDPFRRREKFVVVFKSVPTEEEAYKFGCGMERVVRYS